MYALLTTVTRTKLPNHVLCLVLKKYPSFGAASNILLTGHNKLAGAFFISHCACILLFLKQNNYWF